MNNRIYPIEIIVGPFDEEEDVDDFIMKYQNTIIGKFTPDKNKIPNIACFSFQPENKDQFETIKRDAIHFVNLVGKKFKDDEIFAVLERAKNFKSKYELIKNSIKGGILDLSNSAFFGEKIYYSNVQFAIFLSYYHNCSPEVEEINSIILPERAQNFKINFLNFEQSQIVYGPPHQNLPNPNQEFPNQQSDKSQQHSNELPQLPYESLQQEFTLEHEESKDELMNFIYHFLIRLTTREGISNCAEFYSQQASFSIHAQITEESPLKPYTRNNMERDDNLVIGCTNCQNAQLMLWPQGIKYLHKPTIQTVDLSDGFYSVNIECSILSPNPPGSNALPKYIYSSRSLTIGYSISSSCFQILSDIIFFSD